MGNAECLEVGRLGFDAVNRMSLHEFITAGDRRPCQLDRNSACEPCEACTIADLENAPEALQTRVITLSS